MGILLQTARTIVRDRPPQARVRVYLADCWMWFAEDMEAPMLQGVHWWDDWLLVFCAWFHNWFIAPFQFRMPGAAREGFPVDIIEVYDSSVLSRLESGGDYAE